MPLAHTGVDMLTGTSVWGIFRDAGTTLGHGAPLVAEPPLDHFTVYLETPQAEQAVAQASVLVLAPGVYDRPLPFPGWTLPGVLTPGAADVIMKTQGLLPGRRVLVAGTGPLQMAVAATLAEQGAEVVGLLDTCAAGAEWTHIPHALWGQWGRMAEMAGYAASLLKHRVPLLFRHAVWRAEGTPTTGVTSAIIGKVDGDGHPIAGTERSVTADAICIAYGFAPSIELTLHLGCAHDYDARLGVYLPRHDETMACSTPGVFVAGDVTGAGGKDLAHLQGRIAGISALEKLGALSTPAARAARAALQPAIARERRFGKLLWDRFRVRPGLVDLVTADTPVCRCEGVTAAQLAASVADGAASFRGAKIRTRVGMGVCQGRSCFLNAAMLIARERGCTIPEVGLPTIRPPLVPVQVKTLFV